MRSLRPLAALTALILATSAGAQSAKFAASWDDQERIVAAYVDTISPSLCVGGDDQQGPCAVAEVLLTTIQVPQQKDLLIGVSAQVGLHTFTRAKGKSSDPSLGSATAEGEVRVRVELRDAASGQLVQTAAPGTVTFAKRMQEISVDVNSTDLENLTEVIVGLMLDTTASHHFNYLGVDLSQGEYDVVAVFDLSAFVDIVGEDAIASSRVTLGPRMVTAEEVRASKGSLVAFE